MSDIADRKPGVTPREHLNALFVKAFGASEGTRVAALGEEAYLPEIRRVLSEKGGKLTKQLGYPVTPENARALAQDFDRIRTELGLDIDFACAVDLALGSEPLQDEETTAAGFVHMLDRATFYERRKAAMNWMRKVFPSGSRVGWVSLPSEGGAPTLGEKNDPHSTEAEAEFCYPIKMASDRLDNLYIHTNPLKVGTKGLKAKDVDIDRRLHAILDIDAKDIIKDGGEKADLRSKLLERAKQACTTLNATPKAEVWTGGGIQLWFAVDDTFDKDAWGRVCKALGSDAVQDPSRLARFPGSLNYPNEKKRTNEGRGITLAYPLSSPMPDALPVAAASIAAAGASMAETRPTRSKSKPKAAGATVSTASAGLDVDPEDQRRLDEVWPSIKDAKTLDDLAEPLRDDLPFRMSGDRFIRSRFDGHAGPLTDDDGVDRAVGFADGDRSAASLSLIGLARRAGWSIEETAALAICHEHGELQAGAKHADDTDRKRQFLRCWRKSAPTKALDSLPATSASKNQLRSAETALLQTAGVELWRSKQTGEKCITLPHPKGGARHYALSGRDGREAIFTFLRDLPDSHADLPLKRVEEFAAELAAIAATAPEFPCEVRTGFFEDRIYINMADDRGRVIEVSDNGWRIVSSYQSPIRFLYASTLGPLPDPVGGKKGQDFIGLLRDHIAFPVRTADDKDDPGVRAEASVLTFLTAAARRNGGLPHLALAGPAGAGKTIAARRIKGVFDPDRAMETGGPKDVQSLVALARAQGIPVLDNLSRIGPDLSDALCGLATGTTIASRRLYTDGDLYSAAVRSGVITTSVVPGLADRSDLVSRFLRLMLAPLATRQPESKLEADWVAARPAVLAAFLDALVAGLARLDPVAQELATKALPRLADAIIFAEAVARGLGWPDHLLFEAIQASEHDAQTDAVEQDPLVQALIAVTKQAGGYWDGRMGDLLTACRSIHGRLGGLDRMSPRGLSAALARLDTAALSRLGLEITEPKKRHVRLVLLNPEKAAEEGEVFPF